MFVCVKKWFVCLFCVACCLVLCACGNGREPVTESTMTAVVIGEANDTLQLSIELTDEDIQACTNNQNKAYVYVLPSHMNATADLEELFCVAEFTPKAHQTIEIPLVQGSISRLYSSFVVGRYDQNKQTYMPLTSPAVVSNPQVLQTTKPSLTAQPSLSIKGLVSEHNGDAFVLGVSHVILPVCMETLLAKEYAESTVSYIWNGITYYLNENYLTALDNDIERYTISGVQVYLQFVLGKDRLLSGILGDDYVTIGGELPTDIYLPGVEAGKESYAVNMQDAVSALRMEGFFDFMAERYAHLGAYVSFIVGDRVNATTQYANAGNMPIEAQIANYEKLLRLVHTAMKTHNPSGEVYISLDHHLSGKASAEGDMGLRNYLDNLLAEVARKGDYDFHIACDLSCATPVVWEDETADLLTVHSLSTLTELLESNKYLTYENTPRRLILTNFAIPMVEEDEAEILQASGYAYAYARLSSNPHVKAFFYGKHMDDKDTNSGLRYQISLNEKGRTKMIYDVLSVVDTDLADDILTEVATYIGAPYEKLQDGMAGTISPVEKIAVEGVLSSADEDVEDVKYIANFDKGCDYGLLTLDGLEHTQFVYAESLSRPCLRQSLITRNVDTPTGLTMEVSADMLLQAEHLYMDVCHEIKEGYGNGPLEIVLLMARRDCLGESTSRLVYEGRVLQEDDKRWQRVAFDISDFAEQLQEGDVVVLTLLYVFDYDVEMPHGLIPVNPSSSVVSMDTLKRVCALDVSVSQIFTDASAPVNHSGTVIVVIAVVVLVFVLGGIAYIVMFGKRRRY